jgi:hypothetical protein
MASRVADAALTASGLALVPPRLRGVASVLQHLPAAVARESLGAGAVADAVLVRRERLRQSLRWSAAQGRRGPGQWRLALTLLRNHGRFVAQELGIGSSDPARLRATTDIRGATHLEQLGGGALLIAPHVGPPRAWVALRAHGFPVRLTGRLDGTGRGPAWSDLVRDEIVIPIPAESSVARTQALYRIQRLLADGALVFMTWDGVFGREAFRIDLPGGPAIVRAGWLALRRLVRVPVLPCLTHQADGRRIIDIHPPLPAVVDDEAEDTEACKRALSGLLGEYVRRFPEQCRYLALPLQE